MKNLLRILEITIIVLVTSMSLLKLSGNSNMEWYYILLPLWAVLASRAARLNKK